MQRVHLANTVNMYSAEKVFHSLWNARTESRAQKGLLLDSVVRQMEKFIFFKSYLNPGLHHLQDLLPSGFPTTNLYTRAPTRAVVSYILY
jgi:hypothetical protein